MRKILNKSLVLAITILSLFTSCLREDWDKPNKHMSGSLMSFTDDCLPDDFIQISIGFDHSLGLKSDGSVWTWGSNRLGQLGIGNSVISSYTPNRVENLPYIKQVSAGYSYSIALAEDGSVYSWGYNHNGQLGLGNFDTYRYYPALITSLSGIKKINATEVNSFFIKENGDVWGCGLNYAGTLGNGTKSTQNSPVKSIISGVKEIYSSTFHSIALTEDGRVWVWGEERYSGVGGQGNPDPSKDIIVPILLESITEPVKQICAGKYHSMALTTSGVLWTWGRNGNGSIGNGSYGYDDLGSIKVVTSPYKVQLSTNILSINATAESSFALHTNGNVSAWGSNQNYGLGIGTTEIRKTEPTPVLISDVSELNDSYGWHMIAKKNDGTFWGFGGENSVGAMYFTPTKISCDPLPFVQISAGHNHSLGLKEDGTVWAWGRVNSRGELGRPPTTPLYSPEIVNGLPNDIKTVYAGNSRSFAITSNGDVWAWGDNASGRLGIGSLENIHIPERVAIDNVVSISSESFGNSSSNVTLFLKNDGSVWGCGSNFFGELGTGSTSDDYQLTPVPSIVLTSGVTSIATCSNGYVSAAVKDGVVYTWGLNAYNLFGDGSATTFDIENISRHSLIATVRETPKAIDLTNIEKIDMANSHALALSKNGDVHSWGNNPYGQLGLGSTGGTSSTPQPVDIAEVKDIEANRENSWAVLSNGGIMAWGRNSSEELGIGIPTPNIPIPLLSTISQDAEYVTAGYTFTIAKKRDGTYWAAGYPAGWGIGSTSTVAVNTFTKIF